MLTQVDLTEVEEAFKKLGASKQGVLSTERLQEVLTNMGEAFDENELKETLRLLTEKESLAEVAGSHITPQKLACNILGFESVPRVGSA